MLDDPKTLKLAQKAFPAIAGHYSQQLKELKSTVAFLNAVAQIISELKPEDKGSEKLMQELPKLLSKDGSLKGENSP